MAPGSRRLLISKAVIDFDMKKIICFRSFGCHRGRFPLLCVLVADRAGAGPSVPGVAGLAGGAAYYWKVLPSL